MIRYRLGDIVDIISERVDNPSNCEYDKFVGLEHYVSGQVEIKNYGVTDLLKSAMKVFNAGDILVARRNVYLKRASVVNFDGITSGDSIVLRAKDELMKKLLPFVLNTDDFWEYAEKFSDGTMSKRLSPKILVEYEFNLPDINEQEKLAELLWTGNETIEAYKKLVLLTEEIIKAQYIEIFGDLFRNPKGWKKEKVGDVCSKITGGGTPSKKHPEYFTGAIPWVTPKDMKSLVISDSIDHITEDAVENSTAKIVPANSVLMVIRSGILKRNLPVAINTVPVTVNQDMKVFIPGESILPEFLMQTFRVHEQYLLSTVRSVTADNIEFRVIRDMEIFVPPISYQKRFVDIVKQAEKSKAELIQTILNLENTNKSLMQQYIG